VSENETPDGYELVIPFVSVKSRGGPFDDAAYVAGWRMGQLDARLGGEGILRSLSHEDAIRTEDVPQADLIAMRHQYRMEATASADDEEWTFVRFLALELTS
jgi:hypothetical protein